MTVLYNCTKKKAENCVLFEKRLWCPSHQQACAYGIGWRGCILTGLSLNANALFFSVYCIILVSLCKEHSKQSTVFKGMNHICIWFAFTFIKGNITMPVEIIPNPFACAKKKKKKITMIRDNIWYLLYSHVKTMSTFSASSLVLFLLCYRGIKILW